MKLFNSKLITAIFLGILVVGVFLVFFPGEEIGAQSESKGRIAYVDLWTVFNVHPQKAIAESELNQLAQSMQVELEEKVEGLPREEQQAILQEYQTELSQREQELIQKIMDSINKVVVQIAQEKEVKMVLDKTNVIYGGYDLTEDVLNYIEENIQQQDEESTAAEEESALSIDEKILDENILDENISIDEGDLDSE